MGYYTIQVYDIIRQYGGGTSDIYASIGTAARKIFNSYPIWDESHRDTLNSKILQYYMFRDIGFDNFALWRFRLNEKLNRIMPYYNQLALSQLDFSIEDLYSVNVTEETQEDKSGTDGRERSDNGNITETSENEAADTTTGKTGTEKNIKGQEEEIDSTARTQEQTGKKDTSGKRDQDSSTDETGTITKEINMQNENIKSGSESDTGTQTGTGENVRTYDNYVVQKDGIVADYPQVAAFDNDYASGASSERNETNGTIRDTSTTSSETNTEHIYKNVADNGKQTGTEKTSYEGKGTTGEEHITDTTNETSEGKTIETGSENRNTTSTQNEMENTAQESSGTHTENNTMDRTSENTSSENGKFAESGHIEHIRKGFEGKSKLDQIEKYRSLIMNLDDLIIKELADLFMGIY